MELRDFNRLINFVKKKIYLLIGRAILTAINNDEKTQKVQVTGLKNEPISDIERMQEYGFETYPKTGTAEAIVLFQNGNRDQGLVICVHDRDKRPTDLTEGNVRMYDWNNNKITLTDDGITIEDVTGNKIDLKNTGVIEITGNSGTALEKTLLGETTKGIIDQILDGIIVMTIPSPLGPLGPPVNTATFTAIKATTPTTLSTGVKNN